MNSFLKKHLSLVFGILLIFVSYSSSITPALAVGSAPTATNMNAAETYTEDVARNLTDIVVSDTDSTVVTATLTLSSPAVGSLSTGTSGAVTSTYSAGTGVWTASGAIADVNTLLAAVTFTPAPDYNASFTIATQVVDDTSNSITGTKTVTGTPVNDAPILDSSKSPAMSTITEDSSAPVGAVGTLVSALVDFASPSGQVDNVTDVDSSAQLGIAIIAADGSNFTCYYSTNGGASWATLGAVSDGSARLLAADADNRVYCRPNPDENGTFSSVLTIRAWDMTSGADGGLAVTSVNGGTTAFSSASDTVSMNVTAVNDAPTATNLSAAETYSLNTPRNLIDIVATDIDSTNISATLTLSDAAAGTLSTGTSGAVTSTFSSGVWTASGAISSVNTLLAAVTFTPATGYTSNFTMSTSISDGALSVTGTKAFTGPGASSGESSGCGTLYTYEGNKTYATRCGITTLISEDPVPTVINTPTSVVVSAPTQTIVTNPTGSVLSGSPVVINSNIGLGTVTTVVQPTGATTNANNNNSTDSKDSIYQFPRNLKKGMSGDDVKKLQQFLNTHGAVVSENGPGSIGAETTLFGEKTEIAVMKFQAAHFAEVLAPANVTKPTGWFYNSTRGFVNTMLREGK